MVTVLLLAGSAEADDGPATLRYFNRDIVTLRAPLMGLPPAQRVAAALVRLERARSEEAPVVTTSVVDLGTAVQLDGTLVFFLQQADVDPLSGDSLEALTQRTVQELTTAVATSRQERHLSAVLWALGRIALASFAWLAFVLVINRGRAKLLALLHRVFTRRSEVQHGAGRPIVRWEWVSTISTGVVRYGLTAVIIVLSVEWVAFALTQFAYTAPWGDRLNDSLLGLASRALFAVLDAAPSLAVALLIGWGTWWLTRLSGLLFLQAETGRWRTTWLTPETAHVTRTLVSTVLWLFALVMAYPYLPGSDTEAFKGVTVLLGLLVTIGASSSFGQAAGGLILIYTRVLKIGDQVRIGEHEGRVLSIGIFTTRLLTAGNDELMVPNASIVGGALRNYSRGGPGYAIEATVTIGYDTPWRQVEAMLLEAARATPDVATQPAPRVVMNSLDNFSVAYRLVAFTTGDGPAVRALALSALHRFVLDTFNRYGVQIMSPQYLGDPASAKLVAPEAWAPAPAPAEKAKTAP